MTTLKEYLERLETIDPRDARRLNEFWHAWEKEEDLTADEREVLELRTFKLLGKSVWHRSNPN